MLGESKLRLESELTELREELRPLFEELEKRKGRAAEIIKKVEGENDSTLQDIMDPVRDIFGGNPDKELKETNEEIKELEPKIVDLKTSEAQKATELECVEQWVAGEPCNSLDEDAYVQPALDRRLNRRKEELELDFPPLRVELASHQGEQTRLTELVKLKAERGQIEKKKIEETKEFSARNESALECAKRRVAGEDCNNLLDRISMMILGVLNRFKKIVGAAQDMVERMATTMILVIVENIVLPIIFLAIALKGSVPIARGLMRVSASIGEDTREALTALDQALPGRTN